MKIDLSKVVVTGTFGLIGVASAISSDHQTFSALLTIWALLFPSTLVNLDLGHSFQKIQSMLRAQINRSQKRNTGLNI